MQIQPGTTLGSYEIVAPLGAGGMGEVYRARDPKLDRDVAIKVLPEDFATDPERLVRFEREAKALAALNHPNIATVHGFEREGDTHFLVMELVEGEDLAARISRGPLAPDEAIPVFLHIAEGLATAHARGIIHRDLKPANIVVTEDGRPKILDFGLARAMDDNLPSAEVTHSPTLTANATRAGVLLGTAAYMTPEQARGGPTDRRADIWAFGVCLFEALSGKRPFAGETAMDLLSGVLTGAPPWEQLPSGLPSNVVRTLRRCLEKDAKQRTHDINDVRIELADTPIEARPETAGGGGFSRWQVAALLGWLVAGAAFLWTLQSLRSESPSIHSKVT